MPCERVPMAGGGFAVVCARRSPRRKCKVCGERDATLLCDGPRASRARAPLLFATPAPLDERTCDLAMCSTCAYEAGPDRHLCPTHRPAKP